MPAPFFEEDDVCQRLDRIHKRRINAQHLKDDLGNFLARNEKLLVEVAAGYANTLTQYDQSVSILRAIVKEESALQDKCSNQISNLLGGNEK